MLHFQSGARYCRHSLRKNPDLCTKPQLGLGSQKNGSRFFAALPTERRGSLPSPECRLAFVTRLAKCDRTEFGSFETRSWEAPPGGLLQLPCWVPELPCAQSGHAEATMLEWPGARCLVRSSPRAHLVSEALQDSPDQPAHHWVPPSHLP